MSYPPPPGLKSSTSPSSSVVALAHSSLPLRPPASVGPPQSLRSSPNLIAPTFSSAPDTRSYNDTPYNTGNQSPGLSSGLAFQPRSVAAQSQPVRNHNSTISAAQLPTTGFINPSNEYGKVSFQAQSAIQHPHPQPYSQSSNHQEPFTNPTPPQIRNPFPLPGQSAVGQGLGRAQEQLDPEMEAQIAQWQSAYAGRDSSSNSSRTFSNRFVEGNASSTGANSAPLGVRSDIQGTSISNSVISSSANTDTTVAAVVTGLDGKQKTVVRSGGGQTWQDPSLLEWDPAHFRLFVGNLAGEVTDESLLKAFSKYPSVHKARVVRDKRTTKSKGYGFVSFVDGEEYFQAARDMQGKYIGSHPVLLRKSTTEIRPTVPKQQKKGSRNNNGDGLMGKRGVIGGNGVQRKQGKMKGGLKVLG